MVAYDQVVLPFGGNVWELPKGKQEEYFEWFLEILPKRVDLLVAHVKAAKGYEGWQADYSPQSLDRLGQWMVENVTSKQLTPEELAEKKASLKFPIEIPDKDLSHKSFFLAFDTGMYLSQVLRKQFSSLRWEIGKGGKTHVDYGQPVMIGLGVVPFNPVRVMIAMAYGIIRREESGRYLREIFDELSKMVPA